jgi:pimeloyl-ACP methyl ester carboxylesterase
MPKLKVGDIDIYHEIYGDGAQTLVMIRGLGSDLCAWYEQTPVLSRVFRLLQLDNRGAGRSDKPTAPYSIRQMAADTKGLMDSLRIGRAAMLGISMGGMIAQEFALNYPDRLTSLILGCTHFGGPKAVPAAPEIVAAITAGPNVLGEKLELQQRAIFCKETVLRRPEVMRKFREARERHPIPPHAFACQVAAVMGHDTSARLPSIRIPTLVLTGREDRLVPPTNSRLIAERIPGAVLQELPGGHLFLAEYPDEFNRAIIDFVKAHP